jgi:hypothetical protein
MERDNQDGWIGRGPIPPRRLLEYIADYAEERADIFRRIEELERRFAHLAEELKK